MFTDNPSDLERAVIDALRELGCEATEIAPTHDLTLDLGIDSTELIELGVIIRDGLGLKVTPDLRKMITVSDVTAEVSRLIAPEG